MTKKGPTISAHLVRLCYTCQRQLPRRAYRTNCAGCIKRQSGKLRFDHWTVIRRQYQQWLSDRAEVIHD